MNNVFKILIFLGILWSLSYSVAYFMFDNNIEVGEKIVVIPIKGTITLEGSSSFLSSSTSAYDIIEKIDKANNDDNVKAIVLEINSPGGTVLGSKVLAEKIKSVDKPVVAVITEMGTSGAYWAASQADVIVADELSIVGSISVMGSYLEFSGLLEDYNVTYERLVTGDYKDISSPMKEMTYEEKILVMEKMNEIHDYFVKDVAEGRNMNVDEIDKLANGMFYLGQDCIDNGLVDEIGNKEYALSLAKNMSGISDGKVSEYVEKSGFFDSVKKYMSYSSFYIGQGIGSALYSTEAQNLEIMV